jgi:hypothetical protein
VRRVMSTFAPLWSDDPQRSPQLDCREQSALPRHL